VPPDVAIVGAGHNALTAAAVLASEGFDVVVVERLERPGGALAFDCPYVIHLLHEDVVERIGLEVSMRPLPPRVGVLPDGTVVRDGELEPEAFARWESFWEAQARAFEGGEGLDPRSVAEVLQETFASPEARCLYAPRYLDSGSVAAYAWMETGRLRDSALQGRPDGGMRALAEAFAAAATRAGAELLLGREVARIEPGSVVLSDGERIEARAVVSGADPVTTFRLLGRELRVDLGAPAAKLRLELREPPELPGDGLVHLYPALDWWERRTPESSLVELQPDGSALAAYLPVAAFGRRDELATMLLERVRPFVGEPASWELLAPEDVEARLGLTGAQIHHLPHGVDRPRGRDLPLRRRYAAGRRGVGPAGAERGPRRPRRPILIP
jgi:phytoene dehydrogenase-like protein